MRKLMILSCLFATQISFAQFEDSKWLLGGNIYYNNSENSNGQSSSASSSTSLSPSVAWVLNSNAIIGIQPRFGFGSGENTSNSNTTKNKDLSAGFEAFYRKYKNLEENLFLTIQGSTGYFWSERKTDGDVSLTSRSLSFTIVPGLAYKATDWLLLEARLGQAGYVVGKSKSNLNSTFNSDREFNKFNFSFNNIGFGFVVIF